SVGGSEGGAVGSSVGSSTGGSVGSSTGGSGSTGGSTTVSVVGRGGRGATTCAGAVGSYSSAGEMDGRTLPPATESNAWANPSSSASWNSRPWSWKPTGFPLTLTPAGKTTLGTPA